MSTREKILHRVRSTAQAGSAADAYANLQRSYLQSGGMSSDQRVALMAERLREYDAVVTECEPEQLADAVAAQLAASGREIFLAPCRLPQEWMSGRYSWRIDGDLAQAEIEQTDAVVTAASCAIAESGTIVLHHSPSEGRRVLTLLPDWHLCVLFANQIVELLPEYFARCSQPPRLATFIAGPSATADIEMTRVKGVHGPRFLHVLIVRDDLAMPYPVDRESRPATESS